MGSWTFLNLSNTNLFDEYRFGAIASILTGILTLEVTKSHTSAVFATGIMGIVPAHLMRSIGGGYDNESIALTAMMMTFLCWVVSLRR